MITKSDRYDIIIIGTGAGGGTLAYRLAPTGKKILVLERGDFLPREKENWSASEVYQKERYHTDEHWYDKDGKAFRPQTGYWVGGNTKLYGSALLRLRERDFEQVIHKGGISPAWELKYQDFEPYYTQAEKLYDVHAIQGEDPTDPPRSEPYPYPPISHEPDMQEISDGIKELGYYPFHLPMGMKLNELDFTNSPCIRCNTHDGYPCLVHAKADAEVNAIRPIRDNSNVTLLTKAKVLKLHTNESGREITAVETDVNGDLHHFSADIVVVACGAINSAALLLRSEDDKHPNGLANSSDQVGRNLMKQQEFALLSIHFEPNKANFQKTIAINDFYWGEPDFPYPMGMVQNTGNVLADMIPGEAPPLLAPFAKLIPEFGLHQIAERSVGWWLQTEDLPDANNRVRVVGDKLHLDYTLNNTEAAQRLVHRWTSVMKSIPRKAMHVIPFGLYPRNEIPLEAVAHQCGTCRFGSDPKTSVLDLNCRTHDVDNLYVVDSSFFPSNTGVNPTLTIIANALRVGDHLAQRLK
ncbi:glucose-methanol-choline oxidoreductase [Tolypothrix sp. NIES-4075]|uniref:GMC oxidoreductase n=1 Tax=Tolypothrix sp. NIES-4075 TaxID=2005459 RepID=UPI000B5C47EB|nr:GMC family oxidoreductase [Tolypothrix sp. NIES-4075]GAX44104.1 glucose-methanol-choline oxidoreductase [Tolypothrix sp. NIES-4075]